MENEKQIQERSDKRQDWMCPDCGAECSEVCNTCMFGAFSKDIFYYCEKCRRTYACDNSGKKVWVN